MWFDVSGNFSPKKASAPGEKHHAGCQRRIVAIQVPVHVPGCSSSVLWICPHHTYHRHVTTMSRFLNWIQMALQYRQVQFHFSMCSPDFFCSHNISQDSLTLGSRVHNSIHQSDHRHGIHEPQLVVASRHFSLWIEVRIV